MIKVIKIIIILAYSSNSNKDRSEPPA